MRKFIIFLFALLALSCISTQPLLSQSKYEFSKNGEIHDQIIHSWNNYYRDYFSSEIKKRLFKAGDVYVLYDIQVELQSFVEMTRRCKDTQQIADLVDLLSPIFSALKPISVKDSSTGWICTGGSVCSAYSTLLGKEVQLCSSQYLGLLGALATNVSETIPTDQQTMAEKDFLRNAFNAIAVQLNRWFTPSYFNLVNKRLHMTPADIKDGGSGYFFSDIDLWYLTALSDLSELHQFGIQPAAEDGQKAFVDLQNKKDGIKSIFDLFLARTFLTKSTKGIRAEIDKGFWKYFFDNRYASYTGSTSPVSWIKDSSNEMKMKTEVRWDSTYIAGDAGWDISHSRRLVPAFETFRRNRKNIQEVWGYNNLAFNPTSLLRAWANQIVEKIWNGNINYPLFSNFWSGGNGWYRVAYANQTGRQFVGYPPYGLTESMPTGGFPVWRNFNPTLGTIFRNIFELSQRNDSIAKSFISKYYPELSNKSATNTSKVSIQNFSFLSDLIELPYSAN
jgi:hypothetical protein